MVTIPLVTFLVKKLSAFAMVSNFKVHTRSFSENFSLRPGVLLNKGFRHA
jgi:hypothetical protein